MLVARLKYLLSEPNIWQETLTINLTKRSQINKGQKSFFIKSCKVLICKDYPQRITILRKNRLVQKCLKPTGFQEKK